MKRLKLTVIFLALVLCIATLFGCGKPEEESQPAPSQELCIMSYNVRVADMNGSYGDRRARVAEIILNEMPDSFGVQEATPQWLSAITERVGSHYDCVGLGREADGSGEASAVYYRKDKYDLLETQTKWLSSTPDVMGSKFSGESYIRIVTYAVLQDKSTGLVYVHANTHLGLDAAVRLKQIEVLLEVISGYSSVYPTFVTGDFNDSAEDNAAYVMTQNGFINSRLEAEITDDHETFPTPLYGEVVYGNDTGIIDYCFYNDHFEAQEYDVITEKNSDGGWSSDHYPIAVRGTLTNPDFNQSLLPEIEKISIPDSVSFVWGEDMESVFIPVVAKLKSEKSVILPTALYDMTRPIGVASVGTYTVTATLKGNSQLTASKNIKVEAILQAEEAALAGGAGSKSNQRNQIEYEKNTEGKLVDSGRKVTYVGGLDNAVANGKTPSLTFNFNALQGNYLLKIRVASTWWTFKGDSGTSSEVVLSKVLRLKVNGVTVEVKSSVQPSLNGTYGEIGRTFYLLDFADVTLKNGANTVVIEGFCTEYDKSQQRWNECPVPNIDYIQFVEK